MTDPKTTHLLDLLARIVDAGGFDAVASATAQNRTPSAATEAAHEFLDYLAELDEPATTPPFAPFPRTPPLQPEPKRRAPHDPVPSKPAFRPDPSAPTPAQFEFARLAKIDLLKIWPTKAGR